MWTFPHKILTKYLHCVVVPRSNSHSVSFSMTEKKNLNTISRPLSLMSTMRITELTSNWSEFNITTKFIWREDMCCATTKMLSVILVRHWSESSCFKRNSRWFRFNIQQFVSNISTSWDNNDLSMGSDGVEKRALEAQ